MRCTGLAERSLLKNLVSCSSFAVLDLLGVTARSMALPSRFTAPLTRITWARDSGTDLGGVEGEFELWVGWNGLELDSAMNRHLLHQGGHAQAQ